LSASSQQANSLFSRLDISPFIGRWTDCSRSGPTKYVSTNTEATRLHPLLLVDKNARFVCSVRELGVRGMRISDAAAAFLFDAGNLLPHLKLPDDQNTIEAQQKWSDR
jgi:hypothetical protein